MKPATAQQQSLTTTKTAQHCDAAVQLPCTTFRQHAGAGKNEVPMKGAPRQPNLIAWLTVFLVMLAPGFRASAATVIDPSGVSYTSISASSEFNGSYTAANLFNYDVSSAVIGSALGDSAEWAISGPPLTNAYVAFDLGATHTASSIFYAQRASGNPPTDMMNVAEIWGSTTTAFDPNNPPATAPDVVVTITNFSSRVWTEYDFTSNVTGRYFLVNFIQTSGAGYAPGGDEMRLGEVLVSTSPTVSQQPVGQTLYVGGTMRMAIQAAGSVPLSYQWTKGSTALTNNLRISGATSPSLKITGLIAGDADNYFCTVTNTYGTAMSSNAVLTLVSAPTTGVPSVIVSNNAKAYWQLNEPNGSTVAVDLMGGFDGTYGASSVEGVAGPVPPAFPGFASTNTALETFQYTPLSALTLPALNFPTNSVTLMGWIYPAAQQAAYTGVIFSRQGSQPGGSGITYSSDGTQVDYTWNGDRYYVDTGLYPPINQWSFVALVITPTNATSYLGSGGALNYAVDPVNLAVQPFDGPTSVGCDNPGDNTRVFNGMIDDVAVYDHSLSLSQIQTIYSTGIGSVPITITQQPASHTNYLGGTARFAVAATGSSAVYQWMKGAAVLSDGGNILGADTAHLQVANVSGADAANYSCVVSNSLGAVSSSAASLTVIPVPATTYDAAVIAKGPLAYWQLDEASGATLAVDYWGSFDGTYGQYSGTGTPGPQPPTFPGFSAANTAVQTLNNTPDSAIGIPALNLNTNTVTIMAWVYPSSSQNPYTTLFFSRAAGTVAGLNYYSDGATLGYQWNNAHYDFDSGLTIPVGEWSLVALVITPTSGTLYLGNNGQLSSSKQVFNQNPEGFLGVGSIGRDNASDTTRVFNGVIDEVAVFNRALSDTEMRSLYAAGAGATAPGISVQPISKSQIQGSTATFSVQATGAPLFYIWKSGSTVLSDGGRISGATTPQLVISDVGPGDAGNYSCIVSNSLGTTNSDSASLTVLSPPTPGSFASTILSNNPVGYWQLNETNGSAVAVDGWGSYDGAYGSASVSGVPGPRPPSFSGFSSTNTALQTAAGTPASTVTLPALDLTANTVTFLAWVYPNGNQAPYTGIIFNRANGTVAGLNYFGDGSQLGFQWNNNYWYWASGLTIPTNQWSLVGLVVTPGSATVYVGSAGNLNSSVDSGLSLAPEAFSGISSIGCDNPGDSTREFNGDIDEVAIFNSALTGSEIQSAYNAGVATAPVALSWSVSPSGLTLTWSAPWTLMQADDVTGPWTVASGVTSGVPIPMTSAKKFYRLQN